MVNLQLIDSFDGGYFVFSRNNYLIDKGLYSEIYSCLFATLSSEWWGDGAFEVQSHKIASRTENALKTNNSNSESDINLIKKAVEDDLKRLTEKNTEIIVSNTSISVYASKALEIIIDISGNSDTFSFIYSKTAESLDNIDPIKTY